MIKITALFLLFVSLGCAENNSSQLNAVSKTLPTNYEECVTQGFPTTRSLPPQCIANGNVFKPENFKMPELKRDMAKSETCKDLCGDGTCQEIVCEAIGCPCSENNATCPADCQ